MESRFSSSILMLSLCMCLQAQESHVVFNADDGSHNYANGVVMTAFHDTLYCMWQSSPSDEDSPDTRVVYSLSADKGLTWCPPTPLSLANDTAFCTSGGWMVHGDTLTAFINVWPLQLSPKGGYTYYISSTDGHSWSRPQPVLMADGSMMNGVIEQDPIRLSDGRIIGACHFQPGLHVCPVYTDDASGRTGWRRASFLCEDNGKQSRCLEPSQYLTKDSVLVMVFRDQQSSFRKMISYSNDRGASWTSPVVSNLLDARTKQCAGNLPDGTAFMVSCPTGSKQRWPLVLQLSRDGYTFNHRILLRGEKDLPPRRFEGKAKTLGYNYPKAFVHGSWLFITYTVNKESVVCTRMTLNNL